MKIHVISGFLGSGKTTAILRACVMLRRAGDYVAVITNDQGSKLVDGLVFQQAGIPEKQVGGGCFCCNYRTLEDNIGLLSHTYKPDHVFAEAVGTCTDVVATVVKPLQRSLDNVAKVSLTTIADTRLLWMMVKGNKLLADDISYIYYKQLEEAELVILNKADLADRFQMMEVNEFLDGKFPGKQIIEQNSRLENGCTKWLTHLTSDLNERADNSSFVIDYDRYASGEAAMAFLDQQLVIDANNDNAQEAALQLVKYFFKVVRRSKAGIGHVKFWLNGNKVSLTATGADEFSAIQVHSAESCDLLVNARVEVEPDSLKDMMNEAIGFVASEFDVRVGVLYSSHFRPAYPKPLHRIS
jgi:G3E family GTPase